MIKKRSLAQEVADIMRDKIKSGEFALDSQLPTEPALMSLFSVGRSSIREAIKILVNSGFLRVQQGLGTFVLSTHGNEPLDAKFDKAALADIIEVRQLLELKIATKAAQNRTEADVISIREKLVARTHYAELGDFSACVQADLEFHQAIAVASGNSILAELYRELSTYVGKSFRKQYADTRAFVDSYESHALLARCIEEQDVEATIEAMGNIIDHVNF